MNLTAATVSKLETTRRAALESVEGAAARDPVRVVAPGAPGYVEDVIPVGRFEGKAQIEAFFAELFAALPDFELWVERVVADEEAVAVQWQANGTFDGAPFMGIRPTGARVELQGVDVFEVTDGRITHASVYYDGASFARQIGLLPPAGSFADRAMLRMFNARTWLMRRSNRITT